SFICSRVISKISRSSGSPGLVLFWMPSSIAISIADHVRYPLQLGSGQRNSSRLLLGFFEYIGIRIEADRFRCDIARLTGDSNPGPRRRYEFVVGAAKASSAGAWRRSPPAA